MERPIVLEVTYKVSNTSLPGKVRAILNKDITPIYYGKVQYIYTYFYLIYPGHFLSLPTYPYSKGNPSKTF
mgnify:CR=1 FL=1